MTRSPNFPKTRHREVILTTLITLKSLTPSPVSRLSINLHLWLNSPFIRHPTAERVCCLTIVTHIPPTTPPAPLVTESSSDRRGWRGEQKELAYCQNQFLAIFIYPLIYQLKCHVTMNTEYMKQPDNMEELIIWKGKMNKNYIILHSYCIHFKVGSD